MNVTLKSNSNPTLGERTTLTFRVQNCTYSQTISIRYSCGTDTRWSIGSFYVEAGTTITEYAIDFTFPLSLASNNVAGSTVAVRIHFAWNNSAGELVQSGSTQRFAIPESVKPSLSLALSDNNGYAETYGAYVMGRSQLKVNVIPELAYESPVASCRIEANGNIYTTYPIVTDALKTYGTLDVVATVTDARGRSSDTVIEQITVLDYIAPSISAITAMRCNSDGSENEQGEYLKVTFSAEITSLNSKNSANFVMRYKKSGEESYTEVMLDDLENSYSITDYSYIFAADGVPYAIEVTATDDLDSMTRSVPGPASLFLIIPSPSGRGLAFGMTSEHEDGLDINLDTYMHGKKLTGLANPEEDGDATPKSYVDARIDEIMGAVSSGAQFITDETLNFNPETGVLSVNTADAAEKDNTLPITSAAVHTTVGNIEVLLSLI